MYVLNTLTPIFLLVILGFVLRRTGFLGADVLKANNRLVYRLGLPALLFEKTAGSGVPGGAALKVMLVLLCATALCMAVAFAVARLLRLPRRSLGAFVHCSYRGNLAYVGLPVLFYAFAGAGADVRRAVDGMAMMAIAPVVPLFTITGVFILSSCADAPAAGAGAGARPCLWRTFAAAFANPLVIACAAGLCLALTGVSLPTPLARTFSAVGQMSLPLALLGLGGEATRAALRVEGLPAALAALLKVGFTPVAGLLAARALGVCGVELKVAAIFLACPTAVLAYVMTDQMGANGSLAGSIVVLSTVLSTASLAAVLALL